MTAHVYSIECQPIQPNLSRFDFLMYLPLFCNLVLFRLHFILKKLDDEKPTEKEKKRDELFICQ